MFYRVGKAVIVWTRHLHPTSVRWIAQIQTRQSRYTKSFTFDNVTLVERNMQHIFWRELNNILRQSCSEKLYLRIIWSPARERNTTVNIRNCRSCIIKLIKHFVHDKLCINQISLIVQNDRWNNLFTVFFNGKLLVITLLGKCLHFWRISLRRMSAWENDSLT